MSTPKPSGKLAMAYSTIATMHNKIEELDLENKILLNVLQVILDDYDRDDISPEFLEIARKTLNTFGETK